jgi:GDP-4-dehydro-6-deoxy-D-mannose reductase
MSSLQPGDRIAVTGATGFVGQALVEHLAFSGYEVVGISERRDPPEAIGDFLHDYICADLTQGWPDSGHIQGVVHLAGLAAVGPSFERPQDYLTINSSMVTYLFEHALRQGCIGRVIIVSSGAVYGGTQPNVIGFTESSTVASTSPYVVSKLLVENQTEYYRRRGVEALVVRPFNHIGPGQRSGFIVPDLVGKVAEWQPGTSISAGNLDSARDYTDVRDIVRAYRLLLEVLNPLHTTYNVCTGSARTGWEVLAAVCSALGRGIPPTVVEARRAIDPSVITGSADRLAAETGWRPAIGLEKSIEDFIATCQ